jgi:cellulose synthase/poly-beta-1,6-N-acetylglucosamine synthase-like glycosyltransferase
MRRVLAPSPRGPVAPAPAPSFSIVIVAYEAAATIGEALASAFAQTVPPEDVVVCDDGSTDDLEQKLAPFAGRITLLRPENAGEGAAKNAGVRATTGEFAVFLDADDVFDPARLEALGELAAARPDLDVLTTDALLEVDGAVVRRCYDESWTFEVADQRGAILERNFVFGLAAVRRSRFLAADGFDETLGHATDWDLWSRLILDGARVGLVAEPLARYRLRSGSLSALRPALLRGRCAVLERSLARDDLAPDERRRAEAALGANWRAAAIAEAHQRLVARDRGARSAALRVAAAPAIPVRTRMKALAAAVAPRAASRLLAREYERAGTPGPAGVRLPL